MNVASICIYRRTLRHGWEGFQGSLGVGNLKESEDKGAARLRTSRTWSRRQKYRECEAHVLIQVLARF